MSIQDYLSPSQYAATFMAAAISCNIWGGLSGVADGKALPVDLMLVFN